MSFNVMQIFLGSTKLEEMDKIVIWKKPKNIKVLGIIWKW